VWSLEVSLARMLNEKCIRSPQFSPHPPNELFLCCVNSIISEWHSCLGVFLKICHAVNSLALNELRIETSCLPEFHRWGLG